MGDTTVQDIVGKDFALAVSGTDVKVTGLTKYISEPWTEYDKKDNTGHFAAVTLPADLKGQKITMEGRVKGARTVKVDDDLLLVQRIENLTAEKKLTIKKDGKLVMTVDYSGMTPGVPATVLPQDHDLGKFGKHVNELVGPDVKINPDGSITGEFKYIKEWAENHGKSGYFLPIRFGGEYKDKTKTITVKGSNTATDEDWIIGVDKDSVIKVEIDGVEYQPLTLKGAAFNGEG